jgi:radical SAM-linked protein
VTGGFLLRICHGKTGRLRFLSHLEIVRALERSVRRADLPFAVSQGFSPHMRLAFGPALPVGTAGLAEWLDLPMTEFVPPRHALARILSVTPPELAPSRAAYVSPASPSLSASIVTARYSVLLEGPVATAAVTDGLASALAAGSLAVSRKGKTRTFDLDSTVWEAPVVAETPDGPRISLGLRLGAQGSLRPEALVEAALEYSGARATALTVTRLSLFEERGGVLVDPLD